MLAVASDEALHFVGLANGQVAPVGAGDRASDKEEVVGRVDANDLEVPDGDPGVAVLARLADPLAGVGRVSARAGRARVPVHSLDAVRGSQPLEAVPLEHAREPAPLARADDVNLLDLVEDLDREGLPLIHSGRS